MTTPALIIKRTLPAPVDDVFAAWTDPSVMAKWFAPGTRKATDIICDPVEGGKFRVVMLADDGNKSTTSGIYKEVIPNRKLVHTWQWEGSDHQSQVTIEFDSVEENVTE
ncbi:MAG: SRPBCC domain-containing protein, partial [Pseudomonadota bacterium]